jgi:hypothetical protein
MKIAFGMIVFEGDYVLKECLEQVYPFASQILIAEGPVKYWQDRGKTTSEDKTNEILHSFLDPENKIKIVHGQFIEKDDQCNAYISHLNDDIDYLWNLDSDEVYKTEDIQKTIEFLNKEKPTSVGVRSKSFYGGFDHYLTGFELNTDNFLRIFRVVKGSKWLTHRPPTIEYPSNISVERKHVDSDTFYKLTGVEMYHYSYVFPKQVKNKIQYYKAKVSLDKCIDDYYNKIYLPWVNSDEYKKYEIEKKYMGVHEFKPEYRGDCFTAEFEGQHPESIQNNLRNLKDKFFEELANENGLV